MRKIIQRHTQVFILHTRVNACPLLFLPEPWRRRRKRRRGKGTVKARSLVRPNVGRNFPCRMSRRRRTRKRRRRRERGGPAACVYVLPNFGAQYSARVRGSGAASGMRYK